jgi:protein-L-isoaspartate O-methyltransferase
MLAIILVFGAVVLAVAMAFLVQGPPYVASDDESTAGMLKMVKHYKPQRILDMGSGDGKLIILLAGQGYQVDGVELNPLLVWRSRRAIKRAGLADKASVRWGNFWTYDSGGYDLVTLYVIKHIMPRLEKKLSAELAPGSIVVSNYFVFPNLQPVKHDGRVRAYLII